MKSVDEFFNEVLQGLPEGVAFDEDLFKTNRPKAIAQMLKAIAKAKIKIDHPLLRMTKKHERELVDRCWRAIELDGVLNIQFNQLTISRGLRLEYPELELTFELVFDLPHERRLKGTAYQGDRLQLKATRGTPTTNPCYESLTLFTDIKGKRTTWHNHNHGENYLLMMLRERFVLEDLASL